MNYLAHLYLSGNNNEIRIGNFIADSVKGKNYNGFSDGILFGILLHRKIDTFTDNNQITKLCTTRLRSAYGKFSGAVVDILYDHFLAKNWNDYSTVSLKDYSREIYLLIEKNMEIFPKKVKYFSTFFIKRDRLNCYADLKCFEDVLLKMGIHTSLPEKSKEGMVIIRENYDNFYSDFKTFFDEIQAYVKQIMTLKELQPEEIIKY